MPIRPNPAQQPSETKASSVSITGLASGVDITAEEHCHGGFLKCLGLPPTSYLNGICVSSNHIVLEAALECERVRLTLEAIEKLRNNPFQHIHSRLFAVHPYVSVTQLNMDFVTTRPAPSASQSR